jgi:GT2 family glycosyltransferase/ADP-heptose:LPS heptosyltransferase
MELPVLRKPRVSVVVPLYKSRSVVRDQIRRWVADDGVEAEIIYVDDNCPQGSGQAVREAWRVRPDRDKFPFRVVSSPTNRGFSGACNLGAFHATGEFLIFLNADTVPTPNWIKPILRLFDNPQVGLVGNLQLKEGGELHGTVDGAGSEWSWREMNFLHIGRHSYNGKPLARPFHYDEMPSELRVIGEREMVTGCCVAIRKSLWNEIGGFDQRYRVGYWEDSELCMTVREMGYKIMYQPESVIYHKLSHSGAGPQDDNKKLFFNKWVHSGRIDPLVGDRRLFPALRVSNILVKRGAAHGDVLVASAVCPALKKRYPGAKIYFQTQCESVLRGNPHIDHVIRHLPERTHFQLTVDLDWAYEMRPHTNILTAYCQAAGVVPAECDIYLRTGPVRGLPPQYVALHVGKTNWVGRNWRAEEFAEIAARLQKRGVAVVCVGSKSDYAVECDLDLRGHTSVNQLAYVMKNAVAFVGIDSLPLHVAQAMNTPSVCFFGSVRPATRTYRDNVSAFTAPLPCIGCHQYRLPPVTATTACKRGDVACEAVTTDDVWELIEEKLCKKS